MPRPAPAPRMDGPALRLRSAPARGHGAAAPVADWATPREAGDEEHAGRDVQPERVRLAACVWPPPRPPLRGASHAHAKMGGWGGVCDPRVFCASKFPRFLARWRVRGRPAVRGPAGTGSVGDGAARRAVHAAHELLGQVCSLSCQAPAAPGEDRAQDLLVHGKTLLVHGKTLARLLQWTSNMSAEFTHVIWILAHRLFAMLTNGATVCAVVP
jgi:hypothetical protein